MQNIYESSFNCGEENLYYLTIYIGCFANTKEALETNLQRIESVAVSCGLNTIRSNFRQEEVLRSIMPFLSPNKEIEKIGARNVLTTGLTSTYPFVSNELFDKKGILIGTNSFDKSLIMLDRFDQTKYKNPNMFAYPVFIAFLYLLLCVWILDFSLWHPLWVMFLTIPVYYGVCNFFKKDKIVD